MSLHLVATATATAALALAACGGSGSDGPSDMFDRNALLAHLGQNVIAPIYAEAAMRAAELPAALGAHCDALDAATGSEAAQLAARGVFTKAMDAWQRAEMVVVGPAAMDDRTLRNYVYGWPLLAPCELDRDVASRWADPASYEVTRELVNARSLAAVEYLLYPQSDQHMCVAAPPGWDALGPALPRARCRLAQAIAADVAVQTAALHEAWRAEGGNYVGALAQAGRAGSSLPSAHAAVNLISDAMFYVDRMVKDMKLAEAAGIAVNACDVVQAPCLREVELRVSDRATSALRQNLRTLREVFTGSVAGGPGTGFDDFLIAVGHPELAEQMLGKLDVAIARAAELPDSFVGALTSDYAKVVAVHAAVREFTDDLKSQFLTVLALEIPDDAATDND
jgi:uncharacterized protein